MEEKKGQKEQLPLDAKLLSEAVIELNTSRRSVGLYPLEHPITRQSIERAFALLKKLFELRSSITLGVAKDVLMIDEYTLDSKNPVYREFALALYTKGIATITFYSGLEENELLILHSLISEKDLLGQALIEIAQSKNLRHIRLVPIDISKFKFIEGAQRDAKGSGQAVWEDYIYGIMEGKLADKDVEGIILSIPPEDIAQVLSRHISDTKEDSYDRVITTYLSKKGRHELNRASLNKFVTLVENLSPDIKEQFLERAFNNMSLNQMETEEMIAELTPEDIEKMMKIFKKHSSMPQSLRLLVEKLAEGKQPEFAEGVFHGGSVSIDDIELTNDMVKLFEEDQFGKFVDEQYQKDLENMLKTYRAKQFPVLEEIQKALRPEIIDSAYSNTIIELINFENIEREDHLRLLTKLSELVTVFLETGRFEDVLHIHNVIYSHMIEGKFKTEALSMVEYFFHSEQFISKLLEALKIWGRYSREGAFKLARVLRLYMMTPLLDALNEEKNSSQRKFYLSILTYMGKGILPEAVRRLEDERWYVVRNMIYLIRECNGKEHVKKVRALIKHKHKKIRLEALKTLLHFGTIDAFSYLKLFLTGKDPEIKEQAIGLSGACRIKKAVPYLLEILEKRDLLGADLNYRLLAIDALGKIGDPSAIDTLKKLYSSKYPFYKDAVAEGLRLEIIKSLNNYPPARVRPFLELAAATSKNEKIKAMCQELLIRSRNA